ncbi:MAG: hypothetical protein KDC26_12185 [Armatimonadetes bacterium]|nr:hypothetical protein [Armatimonadota bacterium]
MVCRVLTSREHYGHLELESGRDSKLVPGDVIVGVLGNRAALRGFSGRVPDSLEAGSELHLLNKGGVLGVSDGLAVGLGKPLKLEVLGTPILNEKPAHLKDFAFPVHHPNSNPAPVIAVIGTCMHSGKSTAAAVAIRHFRAQGLRVHAGKATGVGAISDPLSFRDNGAAVSFSFVDMGVPSTAFRTDVVDIFEKLMDALQTDGPDIVVVELGDGVLGAYGVDEILESKPNFKTCIVAANDVIGGYAVVKSLREKGIAVSCVVGPATDNLTGVEKLESLGIPAANLMRESQKFTELLAKGVEL